MIATLFILLVLVTIGTWIYAMYVSWKAERGVPLVLVESAPFLSRWQQSMRLTRRGWYGANRVSKRVLNWGNQKVQGVFVKFFPKAAPVFVKRDMMQGLTHGPSSYFLKSITKAPKAGNKRLPRTKKMI